MKKIFILIMMVLALVVAGCSDSQDENSTSSQNEEKELDAQEQDSSEGSVSSGEVVDLKLKLQKQDEEAGVTIEDNEIYSVLDEVVKADPQMGVPNDFSFYPFDISINPDGSRSLIFLAINRLPDSIKNISFNMTFGNENGEYIWEDSGVDFPEEQFGVIGADQAMPFMLDVTPEQEAIFDTLDMDSVFLDVTDFTMDVVE